MKKIVVHGLFTLLALTIAVGAFISTARADASPTLPEEPDPTCVN